MELKLIPRRIVKISPLVPFVLALDRKFVKRDELSRFQYISRRVRASKQKRQKNRGDM